MLYFRELIAVVASAGTVAILIISILIVVFICKRKSVIRCVHMQIKVKTYIYI